MGQGRGIDWGGGGLVKGGGGSQQEEGRGSEEMREGGDGHGGTWAAHHEPNLLGSALYVNEYTVYRMY